MNLGNVHHEKSMTDMKKKKVTKSRVSSQNTSPANKDGISIMDSKIPIKDSNFGYDTCYQTSSHHILRN